ncbi:hypothetical protein ES707_09506 [subsurface metagenome]
MAILSGKNGTLFISTSEITPVSNWRLRITNYAANDTGGWKKRAAGVRDSSGSFEVKVDDAGNCPVEEGDAITLKLHVDDNGSNYYQVPAVIDRVEVEVDINEGRIVAYVLEFSGNGAVAANGVLAKA